jgi:hypothetical protein
MKHLMLIFVFLFVSYSMVWIMINLMTGCDDWSEPNCVGYFQILNGDV